MGQPVEGFCFCLSVISKRFLRSESSSTDKERSVVNPFSEGSGLADGNAVKSEGAKEVE